MYLSKSMGRLLAVTVIVLAVRTVPAAPGTRPTDEKANYDDGSLHYRVPLDSKGRRNGDYVAYYSGGKKKIEERARYEHGEKHGVREVYDQTGRLTGEEVWVHGRLVFPKSPRLIENTRTQILKAAVAAVQSMGPPSNTRAPRPQVLALALAKLNTYRYLADVPFDVTLSDDYVNLCQCGADVLAQVGHLTHDPPRPPSMDAKLFELGHSGCAHSNLFQGGGDAVTAVAAFMDDSDAGNIARLGHRRWSINPAMGKTGFGTAGGFTAMYSMDSSHHDAADYEFVCFPPRGYCPASMFGASWAWSVSVNPARYKVNDDAALEIYPVDQRLQRAPAPLDLSDRHVDRGGYGIPNVIIGRPRNLNLRPNAQLYEVVVRGVQDESGKAAELSYFVAFY